MIIYYDFQARVGKKKVLPHVVESETSLEKAVMVFLCDGYAELPYHNDSREVFRFHRKLAPYKITFAAPLSSNMIIITFVLINSLFNNQQ